VILSNFQCEALPPQKRKALVKTSWRRFWSF